MSQGIRAVLARLIGGLAARIEARTRRLAYRLNNRHHFANLQIHESMLADTHRVDAYAAALSAVIDPTCAVLDVGTGTGLLALLASQAGARIVHAVDHSEIIEIARLLASGNAVGNVEFHRAHVQDLHLEEKVDLIVHEQMGHYLFEERMVTNLVHARGHLLAPGGRIVPARFEFFVEPVQVRDAFVVPFIWERSLHGLDYGCLRARSDIVTPPEYRRTLLKPYAYSHFPSLPKPILTVDLERVALDDLPRTLSAERVVDRETRVDGLAVFFRAVFDAHNVLDTSPFVHENLNWSIPLLRLDTRPTVRPGDVVAFRLDAVDLEAPDTWEWIAEVR